jgi:hypothetical protein
MNSQACNQNQAMYADPNSHRTPWLTTVQAATYLASTPGTLKAWRALGSGPRYHGRHRFVRYHVDDLDAFMRKEDDR